MEKEREKERREAKLLDDNNNGNERPDYERNELKPINCEMCRFLVKCICDAFSLSLGLSAESWRRCCRLFFLLISMVCVCVFTIKHFRSRFFLWTKNYKKILRLGS